MAYLWDSGDQYVVGGLGPLWPIASELGGGCVGCSCVSDRFGSKNTRNALTCHEQSEML